MDHDKKLFIGLDVGTNSVGWAATDEDFNLCRLKGKTAWGARIFEEAATAKTRRAYRTAGRRLARRKERVRLLDTLFDPLLKEKDPTFLSRLENANLHGDDPNKPENSKSEALLFKNRKEEKEFYKAYPTIWHLRQALVNNEEHAFSDIRYLYLAIHHIVKYRGNFVREGENIIVGKFDQNCFLQLNQWFVDVCSGNDDDDDALEILPSCNYAEFTNVLLDKNLDKKHKASALFKLVQFSDEKEKALVLAFCQLCAGCKANIPMEGESDEEEKKPVIFDQKFDENADGIRTAVGEDVFELIEIAKTISDFRELNDLIGDSKNLSSAFVAVFEEHKKDLACLKKICKEIDSKKGLSGSESVYVQLFVDKASSTNYNAFINKRKSCSLEVLDSFVKKTISPHEGILSADSLANWDALKKKAENKTLLKIIACCSTSAIPMQLHQEELRAILDNAVGRGVKGIAEIEKELIALFKYRIPYYFGPISDKSPYSNVCFKTEKNGRIMPWDLEDCVDFEKTKQKFMDGLTNNCSYLKDKKVLPRQSLLFQDFDAWNKLNNITVNGSKLTLDEMKSVYSFASHRKRTTLNDIKRYLKGISQSKENDITISGLNSNDFIDLSSKAALSKVFDLSNRYTKDYENCEQAILYKTYFTDSAPEAKRIIKERISLSDEQSKALNALACKGWCTLSRDFLLLKGVDDDGVRIDSTIMDHLENGEGNLMQILHDEKYHYGMVIDSHNSSIFKEMSVNDMIEEMPPAARRSTIQAVRIVQEIAKAAKKAPDVIAIEVTREANDSKKKDAYSKKATDRREQLRNFLENLAKDNSENGHASSLLQELGAISDEGALRGKHLFLYFLQGGRDAYTGNVIDINEVVNGTKYDIDHIVPQSLIKDDSIDNMVLVDREINQNVKKGFYPLPESVRKNPNVIALWRKLKKNGMMSDKKYNNLVRGTKLTEQELSTFVESQINVVNRSNVAIRNILMKVYPNVKLIFSKAQYPSQIRHKLGIPKLRDLNDTHHAVDAYLNIVAGVNLNKQFGDLSVVKAAAEDNMRHSLNMEAFINRLIIKRELEDKAELTDLGDKINRNSLRHDFLLTYRFSYQDNAFYDATIYGGSNKKDSLIPIHDKWDVAKYGGYDSVYVEAQCIATIFKGKKPSRYLLGIPHLLMVKAKQGKNIVPELISRLGLRPGERAEVDTNSILPLQVMISYKGIRYLLNSNDSNNISLLPVTPIFLERSDEIYLAKLNRYVEKNKASADTLDADGILNSENSISLVKRLFKFAFNERYEGFCKKVTDIRDQNFQNDCINKLASGTLTEQSKILLAVLSRFTRKCASFNEDKKPCRMARSKILQNEQLLLCSTSVTGLYEVEQKL